MKKVALSLIFSIALFIGGYFLIRKKPNDVSYAARSYLIVKAKGDIDYKYDLALDEGHSYQEIGQLFSSSFSKIYRQENKRWVEVDLKEGVYEDVSIKIEK